MAAVFLDDLFIAGLFMDDQLGWIEISRMWMGKLLRIGFQGAERSFLYYPEGDDGDDDLLPLGC